MSSPPVHGLSDLPGVAAWQWVPGPGRPALLVSGAAAGTGARTIPAEAQRTATGGGDAAAAAGDAAVEGADLTSLPRLTRLLDEVALLAMARVLHAARLFRDGATHDAAQVLDALGVAPRHAWITRRWLTTLVAEGRLRHDPRTDRYHDLVAPDRAGYARARRELDEARRGLGYPPSMTRFFLATADRLPALLRDEAGVQALLFPDGSTDTAEGNYHDNLPSRWANHAAAAMIADSSRGARSNGPLRILELGAGIGATTRHVLDALADTEIDYLFTDVSRFFLTSARALLGDRPGLRFGLFDVNRPPVGPEFAPGSRDVILAANVLHNARHVGLVLAALRELLTPGGLLVLVESCREHYQALTSMYLLMSPAADEERWFTDLRAGQDRVFLTAAEWSDQLDAAGFDPLPVLPTDGHPLAEAGQRVIAGRVRPGIPLPDPTLVTAALAARLPPAERPERVHAVDRIIPTPFPAMMGDPR
ncbi:ubiquinone/menaquinone biosynthesis C-methylase UbiE [Micromonospora pisi]|uniref:Ubiquinone/menaquinone biosynthesis C-methylase UbiE n=1 Tax=Micromonospora pisi TaxID=589240 RepID=A0A495JK30_9ACTN|nr:class I SAM-dependent methyltransferase [Micromonospora pisi]RKR88349.1 ubiquinone/menaquinone biosynthesis C-methylase UbiE [Micromonospora pisi]